MKTINITSQEALRSHTEAFLHPEQPSFFPSISGPIVIQFEIPDVSDGACLMSFFDALRKENHFIQEIQVLDFSNSHFKNLPEGVFQGLTNLRTLDLRNNKLRTLPEGLFQGLEKIQALYLQDNQLIELPENLFQGLMKLEFLYLSGNQLKSLPAKLFQGLTKLELLHLGGNQLTTLPEDLFQDLMVLKILLLHNNFLINLPESLFRHLTVLASLNLSNNQLLDFPQGLFQSLSPSVTVCMQKNFQLALLELEKGWKLKYLKEKRNFPMVQFGEKPSSTTMYYRLLSLYRIGAKDTLILISRILKDNLPLEDTFSEEERSILNDLLTQAKVGFKALRSIQHEIPTEVPPEFPPLLMFSYPANKEMLTKVPQLIIEENACPQSHFRMPDEKAKAFS